jgi:uncharacterized protein Yka (UPF0111/DUF47 family)
MFSIQKFFGKDPQFFDLLEQMAAQARESAGALSMALKGEGQAAAVHKMSQARSRSKHLHEQISELLVKTFVTALEREDIEALSNALYKIPKPAEKFIERFLIAEKYLGGVGFSGQVEVIKEAADLVYELVMLLRKGTDLEKTKLINHKLNQCEAAADELETNLLRDLYENSAKEPLRIFLMKDLYDLLERVIDRCRDAGNVVVHIVLKNS